MSDILATVDASQKAYANTELRKRLDALGEEPTPEEKRDANDSTEADHLAKSRATSVAVDAAIKLVKGYEGAEKLTAEDARAALHADRRYHQLLQLALLRLVQGHDDVFSGRTEFTIDTPEVDTGSGDGEADRTPGAEGLSDLPSSKEDVPE